MNHRLPIVVVVLNFVCTQGAEISPKVYSGTPFNTTENSFVGFVLLNDTRICSGFMLSDVTMLTAAHCFDDFVNGTFIDVEDYILHENYTQGTREYDVAIVIKKYPEPVTSIDFSNKEINETDGTICRVFGSGETSHSASIPGTVRRFRDVTITQCEAEPDDRICAGISYIDNGTTLFNGVLCEGDDGAPLVCDNELVGIAITTNITSCGTGGPDVYQKLDNFTEWIQERIVYSVATEAPGTTTTDTGSASTLVLNPLILVAALAIVFKIRSLAILQ